MGKRFGFTYLFCTDLKEMKQFYQEVLELPLIWEDEKCVAFRIGDHQLSITSHRYSSPSEPRFSIQPGWKGGSLPATSWSLECDKSDFLQIIQNVQESSLIKTWSPEPKWVGYWSYPVLDPMNNTIEVTCIEKSL